MCFVNVLREWNSLSLSRDFNVSTRLFLYSVHPIPSPYPQPLSPAPIPSPYPQPLSPVPIHQPLALMAVDVFNITHSLKGTFNGAYVSMCEQC